MSQKSQLEAELRKLDADTQAEVAVVTVTSLHGIDKAEYAVELGRRWHVGKKGADNGVMFLIDPSEHHEDIAVGTRLEGILTDADSKEILLDHFHPHFTDGQKDYAAAIMDTSGAIDQKLRAGLTPSENKEILSHEPAKITVGGIGLGVGLTFLVIILLCALIYFGRRKDEDEEDEEPMYSPPLETSHQSRPATSSHSSVGVHDQGGSLGKGLIAGAALGAISSPEREESPREDEDSSNRYESASTPSDDDDSKSDGDGGMSFGGSDNGFEGGGASGND